MRRQLGSGRAECGGDNHREGAAASLGRDQKPSQKGHLKDLRDIRAFQEGSVAHGHSGRCKITQAMRPRVWNLTVTDVCNHSSVSTASAPQMPPSELHAEPAGSPQCHDQHFLSVGVTGTCHMQSVPAVEEIGLCAIHGR